MEENLGTLKITTAAMVILLGHFLYIKQKHILFLYAPLNCMALHYL